MQIRIVEQDQKWVEGFVLHLMTNFGATPTTDKLVYEVSEDFPIDDFHGIIPAAQHVDRSVPAEVRAWLEAYSGNFDFYLSLKSQLAGRGTLSPKQIDCVRRAIERDSQRTAPVVAAKREYSYKPGEVLIVGKFHARRIADESGYKHAHHALKIVEIHHETEKAILVTVKLTAQRTPYCGCCGQTLTNKASIAAGIGPICAEKTGLSEISLAALDAALRDTRVVKTWIPKSGIKSVANDEAMEKVS